MTTFAPVPVARPASSAAATAGADAAVARRPLHRSVWPYAGLFAGIVGFAGTAVVNGPVPTEAQVDGGVEVVFEALGGPTAVRIGSALGFLATYALLLFAVGYARHLKGRAPAGSLLPTFVQMALTASTGALFIGFGMKAAAAGGLSGGIDESFYTHTDAVVINTLAGQMQYVGWQGVAVAMAATVVAALRYRMVPVWVGIVGAIFSLFVLAFTMILGLPYSAGLAAPVFLVVLVIGLLTSRASRS